MFWDTVVKPGDRNTDSKDSKIKVGLFFFHYFFSYSAAQSFIHNMQPISWFSKWGSGTTQGSSRGFQENKNNLFSL